MGRKKAKKQNAISDEMEARINSASTSELEAIMAEAGHRYETAKEHLDTDPDICAAKAKVKELTATDREDMKEATNIFRVLIKTLLNAGIITDRTRAFYGMYVDMDELKNEGDRMVGDDIADEGIAYLKTINFRDRSATGLMAAE